MLRSNRRAGRASGRRSSTCRGTAVRTLPPAPRNPTAGVPRAPAPRPLPLALAVLTRGRARGGRPAAAAGSAGRPGCRRSGADSGRPPRRAGAAAAAAGGAAARAPWPAAPRLSPLASRLLWPLPARSPRDAPGDPGSSRPRPGAGSPPAARRPPPSALRHGGAAHQPRGLSFPHRALTGGKVGCKAQAETSF